MFQKRCKNVTQESTADTAVRQTYIKFLRRTRQGGLRLTWTSPVHEPSYELAQWEVGDVVREAISSKTARVTKADSGEYNYEWLYPEPPPIQPYEGTADPGSQPDAQ